jgi:hypothetical protein
VCLNRKEVDGQRYWRTNNEQPANIIHIFRRACQVAPTYICAGTTVTRGGTHSTKAGRLLGDLPTGPAPCTMKWVQAVEEENRIYRFPLASIPSRPRRETRMLGICPPSHSTHDHTILLQFNDALAFFKFWYANALTQFSHPGVKLPQREPNRSPSSAVEIKNEYRYVSIQLHVTTAWSGIKNRSVFAGTFFSRAVGRS